MSRLEQLAARGQSVWLDNITRGMLLSGELKSLIAQGVRGLTSNPSIFEKAIATGAEYDEPLRRLLAQKMSVEDIVERLVVEDIRDAADLFRPLYDRTSGEDGYVSIEVSPLLARNTDATLAEARRLWKWVDRPNVMIKIPATREGIPAIQRCLTDGININVTLIFSLERYDEVAQAYRAALETRAQQGLGVGVASVASFFISRIDTSVDKLVQEKIQTSPSAKEKDALLELLGKVAIANAKAAYRLFQKRFSDEKFAALRTLGARPQRPLWASTGTKNPHYSDVLYVDQLIGASTVNTLPPATLAAFLDHGQVADTLESDADEALKTLERLKAAKIDLRRVTETLEAEGVRLFAESYEKLIASLRAKKQALELAAAKG
ncbi:MAG TPA: transaldolase [Elusimicrobiota bacterium]|jgi:transaldolase|nr:transaldolase [Elusimicrobiota bacterium]HMZ27723.1 transaldolase [Elusimicrobiota bacterium]HNA60168.1 transaldolase [Elusimicrobiota bacterium]HND64816.1 transaldolase [Elusimicrobiota bacterium]HNF58051.1 transaldolase [Elusimicrobiota bacterium]